MTLHPLAPGQFPVPHYFLQFPVELCRPVTDETPVDLQLFLTRSSGSDTAAQTGHGSSEARQSAGTILQLRQLYLCLLYTSDGSVGSKGNVLDAIRENELDAEVIYACGPTPMLRALKQYASENHMECWISMEEKMACGIGACLACVCKSKEVDGHTNVHNKRVCKEGPVFLAEEVEL